MTETDALIARLAGEAPPPPIRPRQMALIVVASIVVPVALFLLILGYRPGLVDAWSNPVVPFKTILPLVVSAASLLLSLRLMRPQYGVVATLGLPLAGAVLLALALWIGAFVLRAPPDRFGELGAASLAECFGSILALSVVPAFITMRIVRQGAPSSPRLSGALVGLTAAAGAAAGYSLFCTRDNPLFFVTWYGAAILLVTLTCAVIGGRVLRW